MSEQTQAFFVRIVTYDPRIDGPIPVPQAQLKFEDKGSLGAAIPDDLTAGADGVIQVAITYDDANGSEITPYFCITVPEAQRGLLADPNVSEDDRLNVPETFETGHHTRNLTMAVTAHPDAASALDLYVGLPVHLRLAYVDFDESGMRNPMAIPADLVKITMADEDITGCWSWLNPEDELRGKTADATRTHIKDIPRGQGFPVYDTWPTAFEHQLTTPDKPGAWFDPPGYGVGFLGGGSYAKVEGLAVDSEGFVVVLDDFDIHRFYPDGTLSETSPAGGTLLGARDVVITARDYPVVLVNTVGSIGLQVFSRRRDPDDLDRDKRYYQHTSEFDSWGGMVLGPHFRNPVGLGLVTANNQRQYILVADRGNDDGDQQGVHILQPNHRPDFVEPDPHQTSIELSHKFSLEDPFFAQATAVAGDTSGRIFAADGGQIKVWQLDDDVTSANLIATWSEPGSGDGQLQDPTKLLYDDKDRTLYVLDRGNDRIQRFDADNGQHLLTWAPMSGVTSMALDLRGDLYLGRQHDDAEQQIIQRFRPYNLDTGAALATNAAPQSYADPMLHRNTKMHAPGYVAFDPEGRLWVSDSGQDRLLVFAPDENGEFKPADPQTVTAPPTIRNVAGVTFDRDGHLYVVESFFGFVVRYEGPQYNGSPNNLGGSGQGEGQFSQPKGIAYAHVDEQDRLYIADTGNNRVQVIQTDGTFVAILTQPDTALDAPEDVAVDARGRIFVADTGNARLLCYDGDQITPWPVAAGGQNGLGEPCGVSVDAIGRIYVTDREQHRVYQLSAEGEVRHYWDLENLPSQSVGFEIRADHDGTVQFVNPGPTTTRRDYYGAELQVTSTPFTLNVNGSDGQVQTKNIPADALLFVGDGETVEENDRLYAKFQRSFAYPDAARLQVFVKPSRAVVDARGLMAVADTGHHRVRLVRIETRVDVNLLDLGLGPFETHPDIIFRMTAETDWRVGLGLVAKAGLNIGVDNRPFAIETLPEEADELDYAQERYRRTILGDGNNYFQLAVPGLLATRQVQRWLVDQSRLDTGHQWYGDGDAELLVDHDLRTENSHHRWHADVVALGADAGGRGPDILDPGVVAHEMGHWVMDRMLGVERMNGVRAAKVSTSSHRPAQVIAPANAFLEGYAEYIDAFWEKEGQAADRVVGRDFRGIFRYDANNQRESVDEYEIQDIGQHVEGYVANALYQLHQMLVCPGAIFADHPAFWYRHNYALNDALATRFARTFRAAFRDLPVSGDEAQGQAVVANLMNAMIDRITAELPELAETLTGILELNHIFLPRITVSLADDQYAPTGPAPAALPLTQGDILRLSARLTDRQGQPLAGYRVSVNQTSQLVFPRPGVSHVRGGKVSGSATHETDAEGRCAIRYTAPNVSEQDEVELKIAYQLDTRSDPGLVGPRRGDSLEVTERKRFLQKLARKSTMYDPSVQQTITLTINP